MQTEIEKALTKSREKIMATDQFDNWIGTSQAGDKLIYYKGNLSNDRHVDSISRGVWDDLEYSDKRKLIKQLNELADHVMNRTAKWIMNEKSTTIAMKGRVTLVQKKHFYKDFKDRPQCYYDYIAVRT